VQCVFRRSFVAEEQPDALRLYKTLVAVPAAVFVWGVRILSYDVGKAVVGAVVNHPLLNVALHRHAARYSQHYLQRESGLKPAVGPIAVVPQRYAIPACAACRYGRC
jgi:hypothetical protein